ncbi:MAG: ATP-binding protein [Patescibacteria group bacterium]
MEHLNKAIGQIRSRILFLAVITQVIIGLGCYLLYDNGVLPLVLAGVVFAAMTISGSLLIAWQAGKLARVPLEAFGNAIIHISPSENAPAPQTDQLRIGSEYVTRLVYQLYQVASMQDNKILAEHKREATQASNILTHLPLPILVFNKQQIITFGSDSSLSYLALDSSKVFGKSLFDAVDLEFPSEFTLESWVNDCQKNKATDTAYWRRVQIQLKDDAGTLRQCDMAGYYNRDNPTGIEFIVTLFDRTEEYTQDYQALSFVALAVHELRTPLTMMRGYIEVFEDELAGKLNPEMTEFMNRMLGAAQQLSTFTNNILNVARVEENQLTLKLHEEKWEEMVKHAGGDMALRARALGKNISYQIEPGLPTVAIDRVSIYEVLCNLLDNAIKYSDKTTEIELKSHKTKDGLIETTIQDHGVGIPMNVLPSLFEKFHRNFRNRSQVSGTGLGLYLSKAIVNAHGGDIWVKSKEGEGTTIGFTLKPYSMLADELKSGNNKDEMVRTAHGWIKNHSLYRR